VIASRCPSLSQQTDRGGRVTSRTHTLRARPCLALSRAAYLVGLHCWTRVPGPVARARGGFHSHSRHRITCSLSLLHSVRASIMVLELIVWRPLRCGRVRAPVVHVGLCDPDRVGSACVPGRPWAWGTRRTSRTRQRARATTTHCSARAATLPSPRSSSPSRPSPTWSCSGTRAWGRPATALRRWVVTKRHMQGAAVRRGQGGGRRRPRRQQLWAL
jgi:hypothetical protein